MSALPAAAAVIWDGFLSSLRQLAVSPWALPVVVVVIAVVVLAVNRRLLRRSRITHLVFLPPGGEIGDDVIAMVRERRGDAWDEALERLVREEERRG